MAITPRGPGSIGAMDMMLRSVLPGDSAAIRRLRDEVFEFAMSPMARAAVIVGPIGGGKSVLASLIAYLKRIAPLDHSSASRLIQDIRFLPGKRIDPRIMTPWYVEMPLTGLVDSLAESQLFGVVKGAFTGAEERPGIFERASGGDTPDRAQAITGGVVFLDEIGDLSRPLQAKLLPVLSQGVYYPVGAEGKPQQQHQFGGVVIAATWRNLQTRLRPDLLSRLAQHIITVPTLAERQEDFDHIIVGIEEEFTRSYRLRVQRLSERPDVDRDYWTAQARTTVGLTAEDRERLRKVDWARFGNLRGLTGAIERIVVGGCPAQRVIDELSAGTPLQRSLDGTLLQRLLRRPADGGGVAAHVKAVEREVRTELKKAVKSNPAARRDLAAHLGIDESKLDYQIDQLDRDRGKSRSPRRSR